MDLILVAYPDTAVSSAGVLDEPTSRRMSVDPSGRAQITQFADWLQAHGLLEASVIRIGEDVRATEELERGILARRGMTILGATELDHPSTWLIQKDEPLQRLDLTLEEDREHLRVFLQGGASPKFKKTLPDALDYIERSMCELCLWAQRSTVSLVILEEFVLSLLVAHALQADPVRIVDERIPPCVATRMCYSEREDGRWERFSVLAPSFVPRIASLRSLNPPR